VAAKAAATAAAAAVNCGDSASCDVEGGWQTLSPERDAVASELAGNVCLGVEQPLAVLAAVLKKTLFMVVVGKLQRGVPSQTQRTKSKRFDSRSTQQINAVCITRPKP
jgi:hypothetical protein